MGDQMLPTCILMYLLRIDCMNYRMIVYSVGFVRAVAHIVITIDLPRSTTVCCGYSGVSRAGQVRSI